MGIGDHGPKFVWLKNELERKAPATLEQPKHGDEEDQQEQEIVEDAEA